MIKKEFLLKALDDFPEEFSLDELVDKLLLVQKNQQALQQSEAGEILSDGEAKERLRK